MTSDERKPARFDIEIIKRALLTDWDPIGVGQIMEAHDEYDSYAPVLYEMLIAGRSEQELFEHLWTLETKHMGLNGDLEATRRFAGRLLSLNDIPKPYNH